MQISFPVMARKKVDGVVVKKWNCRSYEEFLELLESPLGIAVFTKKSGWEGILIVGKRVKNELFALSACERRRGKSPKRRTVRNQSRRR